MTINDKEPGIPVKYEDSYKYLGVDIDCNGDATKEHWEKTLKKFKTRTGWIKYLIKERSISPKHARLLLILSKTCSRIRPSNILPKNNKPN